MERANLPSTIYLDHNATTPLDARVRDAMMPYLGALFGNPSSVHSHGQRIRHAVDTARVQVASLLNAEPEEIVFTSGGTESCNAAILGHCAQRGTSSYLIAGAVEHPAVLRCAEYVGEAGLCRVEWAGVTKEGVIDVSQLSAQLDAASKSAGAPTLFSVMAANNDTGVIMPVAEIAALAHRYGAQMHTDAVQAVGKMDVDVKRWNVDLMSCSAHKLRGPMGVGALFIKRGTRWAPTTFGGHQEWRKRAGTENVAAIVGFGAACEIAAAEREKNADAVASLKAYLETGLSALEGVSIHGTAVARLPGTCYAQMDGIEAETLQMALDMKGISVSIGSACSSESKDPSHVLLAMGVSRTDAIRSVRFSLGPSNTSAEIDYLLQGLAQLLPQLRD